MKKIFLLIVFLVESIYPQWSAYSLHMGGTPRTIFFSDANTGYISNIENILFCTTNQGLNWTKYEVLSNEGKRDICFVNNTTGFGCGLQGKTFKTTNSGQNWTVSQISGSGFLETIWFNDINTGFTAGLSGAYYTTNSGANWGNTGINAQGEKLNSIYFPSVSTGYIVGNTGKIFKTTNGGLNWLSISSDNNHYSDVFFTNDNTGYIVSAYLIRKTINGGANWQNYLVPIYQGGFSSIYFPTPQTGYIVGGNDINTPYPVIVKTTNSGLNWYAIGCQANFSLTSVRFINENIGFTVSNNGQILKTTNGGGQLLVGLNEPGKDIPSEYSMLQNYPNPFNPVTNIIFDIPKSSNVKIMIYNILGKEIVVLVNEKMNAGSYNVDWDASVYPSGVYFYKLVTDDFVESKKMVLIK